MYVKKCAVCGREFETEHSYQKYCGSKCYNASKRRHPEVVSHRSETGGGVAYPKPKRRCHDCGAPTPNYRCENCWSKLRKGDDL